MEIVSAETLKEIIFRKQKELIMDAIWQAAKNFRYELYLSTDVMFSKNTVDYFKKLDYKIEYKTHGENFPYKYTYHITW